MAFRMLLLLTALVLANGQPRGDTALAEELTAVKNRLATVEEELKKLKEVPRVAFSASLGGSGMIKTGPGQEKNLIYKDIITNIGDAYNMETGVFTAPVHGLYYVRFTANGPTDGTINANLYKNDAIFLMVHEQPSGAGSDTGSNGAAVELQKGDKLHMGLWPNTQIYDNSNRHSTVTAILLYPME
ncbi:complement C1q-like protein 4 [Engraulis encrasicolus]|uniref:complement C1q-like protein 4 n=1 Tax=Engraulis encrasicolus TaxID=184585 RepID=UPI002FD20F22